jgi:hypothetical protein
MRRLFVLAVLPLLALPLRAADFPADLASVPGDAAAFVHVRVADLWKGDAMAEVRKLVKKAGPDALKAFDQRFLPAPSSIDRVTVIVFPPAGGGRGPEPVVVVATSEPFDRDKMLKAAFKESAERKEGGHAYTVDPKSGIAIHVLDDKTFAVAEDVTLRMYLAAKGKGQGPFEAAVKDAGRHQILAAINSGLLPGEFIAELPPPIQPLARAKLVQLAVDWKNDIRLDLQLSYGDEDAAKAGEDGAKEGIKMARQALGGLRKQLEEKLTPKSSDKGLSPLEELPETALALVALGSLKQADEILADLPVTRSGSALASTATIPAGPITSALSMYGYSAALLLPAVQKVRMAASRAQSQNNLKQMALAMHNYHDTYGMLPGAAICDKNGKPLLSWRVAILPFIEQAQLYQQFKLDEPWDSDHNKKLIAHMPRIYAIAGVNNPGDTKTHYRVFVGNGALFDLRKGPRFTDVTDGLSNTLMIVEAEEGVEWTKPDDLAFDPDKPLPKLGKQTPEGFQAAFADGSVRFISKSVSEKTLKAMITRAGGEVFNENDK